jgi:hypothetical protein
VIDDAIVWTGSWNLTENCTFRNNNNAVRIKSRQIAAAYRREFEQMHAGAFGTAKRSDVLRSATRINDGSIEIYFSPQGTELEFVIMVIAVSCVKLLSAHNSTQHTSRKHKV